MPPSITRSSPNLEKWMALAATTTKSLRRASVPAISSTKKTSPQWKRLSGSWQTQHATPQYQKLRPLVLVTCLNTQTPAPSSAPSTPPAFSSPKRSTSPLLKPLLLNDKAMQAAFYSTSACVSTIPGRVGSRVVLVGPARRRALSNSSSIESGSCASSLSRSDSESSSSSCSIGSAGSVATTGSCTCVTASPSTTPESALEDDESLVNGAMASELNTGEDDSASLESIFSDSSLHHQSIVADTSSPHNATLNSPRPYSYLQPLDSICEGEDEEKEEDLEEPAIQMPAAPYIRIHFPTPRQSIISTEDEEEEEDYEHLMVPHNGMFFKTSKSNGTSSSDNPRSTFDDDDDEDEDDFDWIAESYSDKSSSSSDSPSSLYTQGRGFNSSTLNLLAFTQTDDTNSLQTRGGYLAPSPHHAPRREDRNPPRPSTAMGFNDESGDDRPTPVRVSPPRPVSPLRFLPPPSSPQRARSPLYSQPDFAASSRCSPNSNVDSARAHSPSAACAACKPTPPELRSPKTPPAFQQRSPRSAPATCRTLPILMPGGSGVLRKMISLARQFVKRLRSRLRRDAMREGGHA